MNCTYNYKGQWLTEEQLLNHPDFKGVSLPLAIERNHILSDTGENTDRQINFFSSATTETGVYENFIQFKRDQLFDLNNRLGKIHSAMKTKEVLADPAKLTRLKNLEREIKLYTEGSDILHIKGLRLEIKELEQSADRNAVGFYAENDLKRLAALAKSDDIDDLREADKLIKFYTLAGSFTWANKDDNPFFTAEEIFLKDENDVLTNEFRLSEDTMAAFKDWANRAIQHQISVDKKKEEITVNTVNNDVLVNNTYKGRKFSFNELVGKENGLKDADWVSMWVMDITQGLFSTNGILPQVMFSSLVNNIEKKKGWAVDIEEKVDALIPKLHKELKRINKTLRDLGITGVEGTSYQIFKEITKEGNETGGLIQRFVKEFEDSKNAALNKFSSAIDSARLEGNYNAKIARMNKAFETLKQWRRANTIIMDNSKIPELGATGAEADAYKQYLISILGEKGYKEQVDTQLINNNRYIAERQSFIDTLLVQENKTDEKDLSPKALSDLSLWETNNSPEKGVEDYYSTTGLTHDGRKTSNYMRFNTLIPRRFTANISTDANTGKFVFTDTKTSTGHYSDTFKMIEDSDILSEFYDIAKEVCEVIREHTPSDIQQSMSANVLPSLMKTSSEMIADKNVGILRSILPAFQHLMERIRLSFGVNRQSEVGFAILDPITKKPNYKVNDNFLRHNSRAIDERMTIEKAAFVQNYNTQVDERNKRLRPGETKESHLVSLKRFSSLPLSKMGEANIIALSQYLHLDLSLADIRAGRLDSLKAFLIPVKDSNNNTVDHQVEVGRLIRNYSQHNVVQSQSFDLPKILKYFSNMTMAYAAREEALPILEIVKKHYEEIQKPKTTNVNKKIFNIRRKKFQMDGVRTNANKQMDDWFERVVLDNYGLKHMSTGKWKENTDIVDDKGNITTHIPFFGERIYSAEDRAKIKEINRILSSETTEQTKDKLQKIKEDLGKERSIVCVFDNLMSWVRTLRLGYNLSSATTNFTEGVISNMILAAQSEYFNPEEIYYGYGVIKHSFLKNVTFGLAETGLARKNRRLMDKFNVIMDSKNELQKSSHKSYANKLSWMNPHELNQRVEYINQSPIMIAMLRTIKIKDDKGNESSVWDAMDRDGHLKDEFKSKENVENWEDLTGNDYLTFKQKLHKVIVLGHGNYDELRGMMIKSNTAGKAFMMFKTWLPMQIYWRFATEQDDLQAGTVGYKGRYYSYTAGSGAIHGAAVGAIMLGPAGFIIGGVAGGIAGSAFGTSTEQGMIGLARESAITTLQLCKKMLGMPINLVSGVVAGKRIIKEGDKAFENWVGKGKFTSQDAKNLRANISDVAIQLLFLAMVLITKHCLWDDEPKDKNIEAQLLELETEAFGEDVAKQRAAKRAEAKRKERQMYNIITNKLMSTSSQLSSYSNPNLYSTGKQVVNVATLQYMMEVVKELDALNEWSQGRDIKQSGRNAGQSGLRIQTTKLLMPGLFKDSMFGFESQAQGVFQESPWHGMFKSDGAKEIEQNKRARAERLLELKKEGKLDLQDMKKQLNLELPTPGALKKMGMTRNEYNAELQKTREEDNK